MTEAQRTNMQITFITSPWSLWSSLDYGALDLYELLCTKTQALAIFQNINSNYHWAPKSHEILMIVCLQKDTNKCCDTQSFTVVKVLVIDQW